MKKEITLEQVNEIQGLKDTCKTIGEWKTAMHEKAIEFNLTDQEILQINRGDLT